MKTIKLQFIFTILFSIIAVGCEDNIPRDRPTFNNSSITSSSATAEEEEEATEEGEESLVEMTRPDGAIVIQAG